ncbi:MAG: hypothetical protein KGK30_07490, partial [Elusimicrobia bacterium]|nr:hypothetical protein [Elusimicrobiota bacterium]
VLARVGAGRQRLEAAYAEYQLARLEHKRHKALGLDGRRHWRLAVKACRRDLIEARRRWKALLKAMNRIAYPSPQQAFSLMAALDIFRGRHF